MSEPEEYGPEDFNEYYLEMCQNIFEDFGEEEIKEMNQGFLEEGMPPMCVKGTDGKYYTDLDAAYGEEYGDELCADYGQEYGDEWMEQVIFCEKNAEGAWQYVLGVINGPPDHLRIETEVDYWNADTDTDMLYEEGYDLDYESQSGPEQCYDYQQNLIPGCKCHQTCGSCGYYGWPTMADDCITCLNGNDVEAVYSDGTGYCNVYGDSKETDEDGDLEYDDYWQMVEDEDWIALGEGVVDYMQFATKNTLGSIVAFAALLMSQ